MSSQPGRYPDLPWVGGVFAFDDLFLISNAPLGL
jgi:hypothetical protein